MVTTTTTTTGNIAILQCKKCGSLFGLDHADVCDICVREELATLKDDMTCEVCDKNVDAHFPPVCLPCHNGLQEKYDALKLEMQSIIDFRSEDSWEEDARGMKKIAKEALLKGGE